MCTVNAFVCPVGIFYEGHISYSPADRALCCKRTYSMNYMDVSGEDSLN